LVLSFLLAYWRVAVVSLLAAAIGGYLLHCENTKRSYAEASAAGQRQAAENARQALRDLKNKERSDENYQRSLSRLRADVKRLRNSSGNLLPTAAGSASSPDRTRVCFDRGELDLALRRFTAGIEGIITEGAAAIIGLDEAKAWARDR
jgi:hypothetical protein